MENYDSHSFVFGEYFCGNKISEYGLENGRVDYSTLAKSFNHVQIRNMWELSEDWELVNGSEYLEDSEDPDDPEYKDFYQIFVISDMGFEILQSYTYECVWYSDRLDMYVWGITHWGTPWCAVLTDIPCQRNKKGE